MKERRHLSVIVLIVVLLLQTSTVSSAQKPMTSAELALYKGADRQQILEEGAKKEGKLTFYTSGTIKQAVGPLVNAFKKKYPFIDVVIWRAGSRNLIARLMEEYKAGKSVCDVIEGTQMAYLMFLQVKLLQPFYSPNLAYIEKNATIKAPAGGFYASSFRLAGVSIGYNTTKISSAELPKTYHDLLNPKWKGKVAIAGSSTGVNWIGVIKDTQGENVLEQIAQQRFDVHMVSGRAILDMIIAGEYALSPTIYD
ncbi:ABC transporter substrate-binding protein, partial [Thermodesulfobacteriota bacterium]